MACIELPISERSLKDLLPNTLTHSLCIHVEKGKEVWVVAGMLVQYLESATDSVLVFADKKPVGTIGGKEIMENLLKNPTYGLFYETNVEQIMESDPLIVSENILYKELMQRWKERGRTYAELENEWEHCNICQKNFGNWNEMQNKYLYY